MKLKPWDDAVPDDPVLQPETPENGELPPARSKQSLVDLCFGDQETARRLFDVCDWEHPEQVLARFGGYEPFALVGDQEISRFIVLGAPASGDHFEVIISPGVSASEREEYRSLLEDAFRHMALAGGGEGPSPASSGAGHVLASPWRGVSGTFPFSFTLSRHGEALALIPAERFTVHAANAPSPFALAALHREFGGMRFQVGRKPSETASIEALERAYTEREGGDLSSSQEVGDIAWQERLNWFRQHYGQAANRFSTASNRGYAYVGPIVGQTRFHYFQLDMIDDAIVRHYKLEVSQGTPIKIGQAYAIQNTGGVRQIVTGLPLSVAKRLARDIAAHRQGRPVPIGDRQGHQEAGIEGRLPITATSDPDDYVRFWFDDTMVGYAYVGLGDAPAPQIQATVFQEDIAQRMSAAGLQLHYSDRGFSVAKDDLAAAAYENLDWFVPEGVALPDREEVLTSSIQF